MQRAAGEVVLVCCIPITHRQTPQEVHTFCQIIVLLVGASAKEGCCLADALDLCFIHGLNAAEGCSLQGRAGFNDQTQPAQVPVIPADRGEIEVALSYCQPEAP